MGKEIIQQNRAGAAVSKPDVPVFRPGDWIAAGLVFIVSLIVYTITIAPTVTLEDSGELVVAAEYLGVPHPPGYPLWTILAWVFTRIFFFMRYAGQPNPAYGVNYLSAFFGALTSGIVALLVSRFARDMLQLFGGEQGDSPATKPAAGFSEPSGGIGEGWIAGASGIAAGLFLSFTPLQWSQAVIAEVYTLNTCIVMTMLLISYVWLQRPERKRLPYLIALVFGLGITNFQPIGLIAFSMIFVFLAADRDLFRDVLASGLIFMALWVYIFRVRSLTEAGGGMARNVWAVVGVLMLISPAIIWFISKKLFTEWRRVLLMALAMGLGLLLFIYMPLASETNPPMNWGYPRTWEGFKHAVTRGQYQALAPAIEPMAFLKQFAAYLRELEGEFTLPTLLFGLLPVFFVGRMRIKHLAWLGALLAGFGTFGMGMMIILNPGHDIQSMFIARVQLLMSYAILAVIIGCGFALALGFLKTFLKSDIPLAAVLAVAVLSPSVLVWKNYHDEELARTYGGANLDGFDFGWQFGCYQLCGVEGIIKSLKPGEERPPNPNFPPAMEPDAIFFGGTDPGRFVPTYMIFSARVRPDVFLITQNALADNTYMNVMRDLYGNMIWIPTPNDSNIAFQSYVNDIRSGRIPANAAVTVDESGKVSVQGVQGVMEINGIICRMIFDKNKSKHDFYIEESYVISWMYPYLEPHGLIMKINKEPLPGLSEEMIKNDMDFWGWYCARLLNDESFLRSAVARKTFSKLRCAIGGLYAYRRLFDEAETALRQAIELSPISPEANFRLADLYLQQSRFQDAAAVMQHNQELDPRNDKIAGFLNRIKMLEHFNDRMMRLQAALAEGTGTLEMVFELAHIYQQTGREQQFYELTRQIINNESVPPDALLKIAEMHATSVPQRLDFMAEALEVYLKREPGNPRIWFEMACVRTALGQNDAALKALREAVMTGGEPIKDMAGKDNRLAPLKNSEEYRKLTEPAISRRTPFPGSFIP